jgi:dTDP-glucose pyrophosphorylase
MGEFVTEGIENYLVPQNGLLSDAVEKLCNNKHKGLAVIENGKLTGLFTRRDMVKCSHCFGIQNVQVGEFANHNFEFCLEIGNKELESFHAVIPVLKRDGTLKGLFFPENNKKRPNHPCPVVINAGGKGTRLYPFTETVPKPLVEVIDGKPMVETIMDQFHKYKMDEFHMIVNHKKEMVEDYFESKHFLYHINFYEEESPLGTGGGLRFLKDKIHSTFFFSNCDTIMFENCGELYEFHKEANQIATMIVSLKPIHIPYGVIQTNENQKLSSSIEKPTYMTLVNIGMYILEPEIFNYIDDNENISFPDVLERARDDGKDIAVYPITADRWLDMGQISELEHAKEVLRNRIKEESKQ